MCWVCGGAEGKCVHGEGKAGYNRAGAERGKSSLIHLYTGVGSGVNCPSAGLSLSLGKICALV